MKQPLKILALDLANKTGWAHSCGESGVQDLSPRKNESSSMRLISLRGWLRRLYGDVGADLVVFESAIVYGGKHASGIGVSFEMQSVLKVFCEDNEIDYRGFAPTEIKRHATGKGNAGKPAVVAAAREKWPSVQIADDNQADAMWLLDLAQKEYEF